MSGGQLVVLDRLGRDVKRFPLPEGVVTLGSDHSCDIRFMLDTVDPHHATVAVHANQTVVRAVCGGRTLVNGAGVSVAALRHRDVISIGGRQLRWEYARPAVRRHQAPLPALALARRRGGSAARRASGAAAARRDPALLAALEMSHRASMPANPGGKQVAIVQPQRRDTSEQTDKATPRSPQSNKRPRASKNDADKTVSDAETEGKRPSRTSRSPGTTPQNTTKASLWIESRKSSPRISANGESPRATPGAPVVGRRAVQSSRKSTPLRMTVLRKVQSARKATVAKIEAPTTIDHTKQAALLLMTGHTPKSKLLSPKSPNPKSTTSSTSTPAVSSSRVSTWKSASPRRGGRRSASFVVKKKSPVASGRGSRRSAAPAVHTSAAEDAPGSARRKSSRRSETSPSLPTPKKSALKNPLAKKSMRKTESIKFDLSNLERYSRDSDGTSRSRGETGSEDELALRYSDASSVVSPSPSPRRSIHSRAALSPSLQSRTLTPGSASTRQETSRSAASRRTRTLESYSIVDLVSVDSPASGRSTSVYDSAESFARSTATRSTLEPALLGSSTPYVRGSRRSATASRVDPDATSATLETTRASGDRSRTTSLGRASGGPRRSAGGRSRLTSGSSRSSTGSTRSTGGRSRKIKSLSTPENASVPISVNSTRVSRASRSRSRIDDSDLLFVELDEAEASPRSSRRASARATPGISTPDNTQSPEEAATPVLSIQSLLDSSQGSGRSQSAGRRGPRAGAGDSRSTSFARRRRLSDDSYESMNVSRADGAPATPRGAIELIQEAVKNKHSSAKKPQSRRSIIDDLNDSDVSKQLFSSPVKRKLSQSITEISRKQLFDDEEADESRISRALSRTTLLSMLGRTPDDSLLDRSEAFTPERFVSPIGTPTLSPDLAGIKRLFAKKTPDDDLRNVRGVKALLRTPRARKSIKNDLTDVAGVKEVFAAGLRNSLRDVRVKKIFAASPSNDLRRVSGVKTLFQSEKKRKSPRNSLGDVRGVKQLFNQGSPVNDLRNVSGVKKALKRRSPTNDLRDVRGVKRLFRRDKRNELSDVSGVEELFDESSASHRDADSLFDQLIGKPTIKAVYSRTFTKPRPPKRTSPKSKSLLSLDLSLNTEEWLKENLKMLQELRKKRSAEAQAKSANKSNVTRELQKLAIATVEGDSPLPTSRIRSSTVLRVSRVDRTIKKSASESYEANTLPLKKRSLVNASLDKVNSDSRLLNLPIKKRVVVHSTPVKGKQANVTMNASELGRVSPIAPEKPRHLDNDLARSTIEKATPEVKSNSRRATRAQPSSKSPAVKKPSPNKSRGKSKLPSPTEIASPAKKAESPAKNTTGSAKKVPSPEPLSPLPVPVSPLPVSPKSTRSRRAPVSPKAAPKKRGAKLVVAKKSPVMSPQPAVRKRKEPELLATPNASPKKTRATRNKVEKVVKTPNTPKSTRAKALKATVVVTKPSPQLKPRATRGKPKVNDVDEPNQVQKVIVQPKATRKAGAKTKIIGSPKKSPVPSPRKSRRKVAVEETIEVVPKTRGKAKASVVNDAPKQSNVEVEKTQPKTRRGRTATEEETIVPKKVRKTEKQEVVDKKTNKKQTSVEESKPVVKKTKNQGKSPEESKATRGKKNIQQETVEPVPSTRSRRGAKADVPKPEANTRKRKTDTPDVRPSKVSKNNEETVPSRGRNKKIESPKTVNVAKKNLGKGTAAPVKVDASRKTGRAKKAEVSIEVPKKAPQRATRQRKVTTAEVAAEVGRRGRKAADNATPLDVAGVAARRSRRR